MPEDAKQIPSAYWAELMHAVGPGFAERADRHDANDTFVAENFAELKERGVLAAGVPVELGKGVAAVQRVYAERAISKEDAVVV